MLIARFTDAGAIRERILIADPNDVGEYEFWRDLAVAHMRDATQAHDAHVKELAAQLHGKLGGLEDEVAVMSAMRECDTAAVTW